MRQLFFFLLILTLFLTSGALAWQPLDIADGTSAEYVPFYSTNAIRYTAGGVTDVQIKNDGSGVVTVSLWRYINPNWKPVFPFDAAEVGQTFYGVADSVYTIDAGETLFIENIIVPQRPHAAYITRPTSTSAKVLWR